MQSESIYTHPDRPRLESLWNGGDNIRESVPRVGLEAATLALASGTLYLIGVPLFASDAINRVALLSSNNLVKGADPGSAHQWVAWYTPELQLMGQSVDEGDSTSWEAGLKTFSHPLVRAAKDGIHYLGVYQERGTGGSPASSMLYNRRTGAAALSVGVGGQKQLSATFTTGGPFGATAPSTVSLATAYGAVFYVAAWRA